MTCTARRVPFAPYENYAWLASDCCMDPGRGHEIISTLRNVCVGHKRLEALTIERRCLGGRASVAWEGWCTMTCWVWEKSTTFQLLTGDCQGRLSLALKCTWL